LKVIPLKDLKEGHSQRLKECSHLKHHSIPYTGQVVVYTHRPITKEEFSSSKASEKSRTREEELKKKDAFLKLLFK